MNFSSREYMITLPMCGLASALNGAVSESLRVYYQTISPGLVSEARDSFVRLALMEALESKGMWLARIVNYGPSNVNPGYVHRGVLNNEVASRVPNLKESLSKGLSEALDGANLTSLFTTETTWRILTCSDILICVVTLDN